MELLANPLMNRTGRLQGSGVQTPECIPVYLVPGELVHRAFGFLGVTSYFGLNFDETSSMMKANPKINKEAAGSDIDTMLV